MVSSAKRPFHDIDFFLGKSYDDVPFGYIEHEEITINHLKVKIARLGWLIRRGGNGKRHGSDKGSDG